MVLRRKKGMLLEKKNETDQLASPKGERATSGGRERRDGGNARVWPVGNSGTDGQS